MARAFDWQSRGQRFDSAILHKRDVYIHPFSIMKFFVYIIRSTSFGKLYIGQTQDLEKRISDHNKGRSNYTKPYKPWNLLAYKVFDTRSEAMAVERKLKNLKSQKVIFDYIHKNNFVSQNQDN